jgi:hypothetical protein
MLLEIYRWLGEFALGLLLGFGWWGFRREVERDKEREARRWGR